MYILFTKAKMKIIFEKFLLIMFELRYVWAQKNMFSYPSEYSVNLKFYLHIIPPMRMSMWDVELRVNPYGSGAQFFPSPTLSLTSGAVVSLLFSQAVHSERQRSTPQCGFYSKLPKLSGPNMQSMPLPTSQNCHE